MVVRPADCPCRPIARSKCGACRASIASTLSKAFTRALAPNPRDRFASCTEFCGAIASAVVPELPFDSKREGASRSGRPSTRTRGALLAGRRCWRSMPRTTRTIPSARSLRNRPTNRPPSTRNARTRSSLRAGTPSTTSGSSTTYPCWRRRPSLRSRRRVPAQHNEPDLDTIAPPSGRHHCGFDSRAGGIVEPELSDAGA